MSTCSLPIFRKRHLFQLFASSLLLSVVPSVSMAASPTVAHEKFTRQSAGASLRQTTKSSYGDAVVVNAASYLPGISPGGLVTIFGHNLTDVNGIVLAGTDPFPDQLAGVSVLINRSASRFPIPLLLAQVRLKCRSTITAPWWPT
jgi:hypothetical protein